MPVSFDRDRFLSQLRFSLGTMLVLTIAYAAFIFWFFPARQTQPSSQILVVALWVVGTLLLAGGGFAWFRTPTPRMMELPSRKLGKAERASGWPPRAEAFRKRLQFIIMLLQSSAVAIIIAMAVSSERFVSILLLAGIVGASGWIWIQLPDKVHEVLG